MTHSIDIVTPSRGHLVSGEGASYECRICNRFWRWGVEWETAKIEVERKQRAAQQPPGANYEKEITPVEGEQMSLF